MTERVEGRTGLPVRDRQGTEQSIARELTEEERSHGLPCWVRHEDAGGYCEREAQTMVYGLLFCGVHGAEAKAGALLELYQDAAGFLERLDNPHAPIPNAEFPASLHQEGPSRIIPRVEIHTTQDITVEILRAGAEGGA